MSSKTDVMSHLPVFKVLFWDELTHAHIMQLCFTMNSKKKKRQKQTNTCSPLQIFLLPTVQKASQNIMWCTCGFLHQSMYSICVLEIVWPLLNCLRALSVFANAWISASSPLRLILLGIAEDLQQMKSVMPLWRCSDCLALPLSLWLTVITLIEPFPDPPSLSKLLSGALHS